jgi:nucleoside-diphosphate-sugar epimerase
MASTALVTGATGLVGRALTAALAAHGATVVAFAGDVTDANAVAQAVAEHRPDAVFHLAARTTAAAARRDPEDTWHVNVEGTRAVLEAAAGARVIVAGTVAAYAPAPAGTTALTEDLALVGGAEPYAASKAAADALARSAGATVARLTNIYGPGDRRASRLVPELVAAAAERRAPALRSDGGALLDLLHADDAAIALIALWRAVPGEAYNIGVGETVTVRAVVEAAERVLGRPLHVADGIERAAAGRPGVSIAKVADATGWRPRIGLDDGLRRTLAAG